jgi:hypothetical protein
MDLLSITYEAAYRRMKTKVPFRLDEVLAIANHFNCSVDSIFNITSIPTDLMKKNDSTELYATELRKELEIIKRICSAKNIEANLTINHIPFKYFTYPTLFRLEYFMWLHRHRQILCDHSFSDIVIPDEIQSLHKECIYYMQQLKNVTCCVSDQTFESIIQCIMYYRQMQKISNQDLSEILNELRDVYKHLQTHLLDRDEKFLFNGTFYYKQLPININSLSAKYDNDFLVMFLLYDSMSIVYQNDSVRFDIHQDWFNCQIFVSQLISGTNSLMHSQLMLKIKESMNVLQNMLP